MKSSEKSHSNRIHFSFIVMRIRMSWHVQCAPLPNCQTIDWEEAATAVVKILSEKTQQKSTLSKCYYHCPTILCLSDKRGQLSHKIKHKKNTEEKRKYLENDKTKEYLAFVFLSLSHSFSLHSRFGACPHPKSIKHNNHFRFWLEKKNEKFSFDF